MINRLHILPTPQQPGGKYTFGLPFCHKSHAFSLPTEENYQLKSCNRIYVIFFQGVQCSLYFPVSNLFGLCQKVSTGIQI